MFTIFPAIDLRKGRVVRLKQGRAENESVYSDDPARIAQRWAAQGAEWLHVVNLDGAFGESGALNVDALTKILAAVKIPVQFGGGLRDLESMRRALALGVARVIIGTAAVEQPAMTAQALHEFGAERVAVAIDARAGIVATRGWAQGAGIDAIEFGKRLREGGVTRAIVTDIARDGMMQGIDAGAMAAFARATGLRVSASGGVASLEDIRNLLRVSAIGIEGVIVGQALYTETIRLTQALEMARGYFDAAYCE
ncbi:MAG: 1-(5-phosphoribosyl)-5-[(5-phosphoribosylamino)methylideneamino] imidazole-4-carboxamide isomerase [Anaerolineae bacterium]|nr:1-(5-phosphoribosyl)-5-[(5-phosphoribosylamino)methylideneamino] imidazole-4-carboxamide isomerase [Anaerolineae bacterium]